MWRGWSPGLSPLRLEADAVLDLWRGDDGQAGGDVAAARQEILGTTERVTGWYDSLATTMITGGELPSRSLTTRPPTDAWSGPYGATCSVTTAEPAPPRSG